MVQCAHFSRNWLLIIENYVCLFNNYNGIQLCSSDISRDQSWWRFWRRRQTHTLQNLRENCVIELECRNWKVTYFVECLMYRTLLHCLYPSTIQVDKLARLPKYVTVSVSVLWRVSVKLNQRWCKISSSLTNWGSAQRDCAATRGWRLYCNNTNVGLLALTVMQLSSFKSSFRKSSLTDKPQCKSLQLCEGCRISAS